jgi:hypothetical protein
MDLLKYKECLATTKQRRDSEDHRTTAAERKVKFIVIMMAGSSLSSKVLSVHDDSASEMESDLMWRQPSNPTEVAKHTLFEVQVEDNVERCRAKPKNERGKADYFNVSENINTKKMKNPSIELLTVIWKAMQEEKLESERVRQEKKGNSMKEWNS